MFIFMAKEIILFSLKKCAYLTNARTEGVLMKLDNSSLLKGLNLMLRIYALFFFSGMFVYLSWCVV